MLGPSQSQTGEEEAELMLGVPTGGKQGRKRPGQKQAGLEQQAPLLDRIGSAMQQSMERAMSPVLLPVAPPPLFLTLRNKDPHSLRSFFTEGEAKPQIPGFGSFWGLDSLEHGGTEKILQYYPVVYHYQPDKELLVTSPPPTEASGDGPKKTCSPTRSVLRYQDLGHWSPVSQKKCQPLGLPWMWCPLLLASCFRQGDGRVEGGLPGGPKHKGNNLGPHEARKGLSTLSIGSHLSPTPKHTPQPHGLARPLSMLSSA